MSETTFDTAEIMAEETGIQKAQPARITSFADNLMVDVTEQGYWASFKVETMDDKKVLFAARNDNAMLKDHMGEVIDLVGVVIDTKTINDAQVGAKTVPCVHLIDASGKVYQSASTGVVNSACDIMSTFGMPDTWGDEPLQVVCKETTTNSGNRFKYLGLV